MKSRILRLVLALIVVGAIAGIGTWLYVFKKADSNVASRKVDVEISAKDLVTSFETNETTANALFLDKVILVEGTIDSISEDSLGISINIKSPDEIAGVICTFSKGDAEKENFTLGHPVKVKGLCTGYLMDVVLNKCSVVN